MSNESDDPNLLFNGYRFMWCDVNTHNIRSYRKGANPSATDGNTPLGLTPGAAAGYYPLSDLDQIGLFNGDLNFKLPLMHIGGRGAAGYTMMLQAGVRGKAKARSGPRAPSMRLAG